jgi:hypothetical protein
MRRSAASRETEIALLQQRIYLRRLGLRLHADAARQALRERLTSPAILLAAVAVGMILGAVTNRRGPANSSALGRLSALLTDVISLALKFAQSGPLMWIAAHLTARKQQAQA